MAEIEHPLWTLHGRSLDGLRLHLTLGPTNPFGARYFHLFALDSRGRLSSQPILTGLFSSGSEPAYNWVEIASSQVLLTFISEPGSARRIVVNKRLFRRILRLLSGLVPPGGHFMVEYDSPQWLTTRQALSAGVPPLATPLGSLVYEAGFVFIRDWDLAEGGREGWRKLWGYKAWDEAHARARTAQNVQDILDYLASQPRPGYDAVEKAARRQARRILKKLSASQGEPLNQVGTRK